MNVFSGRKRIKSLDQYQQLGKALYMLWFRVLAAVFATFYPFRLKFSKSLISCEKLLTTTRI